MSSLQRLEMFALISSIETDLRDEIKSSLVEGSTVKTILGDRYDKCVLRFEKDFDDTECDDERLVEYIDFADAFLLLNNFRSRLSPMIGTHLRSVTQQLSDLTPIRNRVMHSRPLHFDDLAKTKEIASLLVRKMPILWQDLQLTSERLKADPSFVFGLTIPPPPTEDGQPKHNLPFPDFDETGFIGRESHVIDILKKCRGAYPVITIVGDGGIGKTALALKVAYEIVDSNPVMFDYIVWTSSKTTRLTVDEIVRIEGAIQSSTGVFQSLAKGIGVEVKPDGQVAAILDYMEQFRILLVLDNLETVLDDNVREFLGNIPQGSKVLITSRIGLGELEQRVPLRELEPERCVDLLRSLAKARYVEQLGRIPNPKLEAYCAKMKFNPGFIKWFVSAVQSGKRPEDVLNKTEVFLDYCMSNVYHFLAPNSQNLLQVLQTVAEPLSQAELDYMSRIDTIELNRALHQLLSTNMVRMQNSSEGSSFRTTYELSDLARLYLSRHHPPTQEESRRITRLKNELTSSTNQLWREASKNPNSIDTITVRSKSELIVTQYLKEAMHRVRKDRFDEAAEFIKTAKLLAPEFYQVHRIEAYVLQKQGLMTAAKGSYETAIELEPHDSPLRRWYAQFLLKEFQDFSEAQKQIEKAAALDPGNFVDILHLGKISLALGDFPMANDYADKLREIKGLERGDQIKIFDFRLKIHGTKAHSLAVARQTTDAIQELKLLILTFIDCGIGLIDFRMRERLHLAKATVEICRSQISVSDSPSISELDQISNFLSKNAKVRMSVIETDGRIQPLDGKKYLDGAISSLKATYGFILGEDGETYFFHFDSLKKKIKDKPFVGGEKVMFKANIDQLGKRSASAIRRADEW